MEIETFARAFLGTYFVLLAMFYHAKQRAHAVRDGDDRVHYGPKGSAHRLGRRLFNIFRLSIVALMAARVFAPGLDAWMVAFPALTAPISQMGGVALMLGGLWIALYAHNYMGALWQSGVPGTEGAADRADALLQRGPFARSRNPIFLGVQLAQIGLFLAFPSLFTLVCLVVGVTVLQRQARIEEAALTERFGPSYAAYAARTPRWI